MEIAFDFGPEIRTCRMKLECRFVVATQCRTHDVPHFLSHHTKNTNLLLPMAIFGNINLFTLTR